MQRFFYSNSIADFKTQSDDEILGILSRENSFSLEQLQRDAWLRQISVLKRCLQGIEGQLYLEYSIPRMGRRIDALLLVNGVIVVLEFKVGATQYLQADYEQVWDYALDLRNFHETSHTVPILPVLIATSAQPVSIEIVTTPQHTGIYFPVKCNAQTLHLLFQNIIFTAGEISIDPAHWEAGRYKPTPTIIEAAIALYSQHSVADITRSDASATNLSETSGAVLQIIEDAKAHSKKSICFVTGVPGAGKTLVGLDIATKNIDKEVGSHAVFLSGNGPLVAILREALVRDKVAREKEKNNRITKSEAGRGVKAFIQNVHEFRDEGLQDKVNPPEEHIAIFDEAQRAWNKVQTATFMQQKRGEENFQLSEPAFLISCLDRHQDWSVVVCLVGGGQEINTGEGGIAEWLNALNEHFPEWHIYISSRLQDTEYSSGQALQQLEGKPNVSLMDELHLSVSMRSFRAEHLAAFVKAALDLDVVVAREHYKSIQDAYPIVITRDLTKAKRWLKSKASGSERYGLLVSSQAVRLKPHAIDVRYQIDPVVWFLNDRDDIRSSYYLEDVATEFKVQGLELDWTCVTWDADFRYNGNDWKHFSFRGNKWQRVLNEERKKYLKNAYRVLLTRARQGMVLVVPEGDAEDVTRSSEFYDGTWEYLVNLGLQII